VEKRLAGIPQVLGSAGQLQEVVLNLVINAIHAIHAEGRIEIILETEGSTVRLTVRDNGCGIPPENLDRIFDPFFTTKGALGGGSVGGSGLGLSISYNIVNAHSGTIQVQSEPGKGTTFTITLPAMAAGAGAGDPQGPGAGAVMESTGREILAGVAPVIVCESVLVGDTEEAVQEMIVQYLGARETVGARSWSEIQDACQSRSYEFLILDLELPGLPGLPEALEAIGSSSPDTQIIITSRSIPDPGLQKILREARGHLLKPYTIENLAGIMSIQPQMHPTV
jgi:CheY-like chemotaxis protein